MMVGIDPPSTQKSETSMPTLAFLVIAQRVRPSTAPARHRISAGSHSDVPYRSAKIVTVVAPRAEATICALTESLAYMLASVIQSKVAQIIQVTFCGRLGLFFRMISQT